MSKLRKLLIALAVITACLSFYALCMMSPLITVKYSFNNSDIQPEVSNTYAFTVALPTDVPYGDETNSPNISTIIFTENGTPLSPHSVHDDIRKKGKGAYSHWGTGLIFSSTDNSDPRTNGKVYEISYEVMSTMASLLWGIFLISLLSLAIYFRKVILFPLILMVPVFVGVLLLIFVISAFWAWTQDITPAITGMFKLIPDYLLFTGYERFLFIIIILWGVLGLICSYIANGHIADKLLQRAPLFIKNEHDEFKKSFKITEEFLCKTLRKFGLIFILFLTFFSLANFWAAKNEESSRVNQCDYARTAFAGFIPYSDASGYLLGSYHITDTGTQYYWNQRRPLNASFYSARNLVVNYDFILSMMLQTLLAGIAVYFAAAAIAACFGIWSSVIYSSLALTYLNMYIGTTLSEALGFSLGAIAAGFIVLAHYRNSYTCGLWGILAFCLAQSARMGTLFMIPALILWFIYKFYDSNKKQYLLKLMLLLIVLFAGCGISKCLNSIYGDGTNTVGSNFAYTICGMTIGKSWSDVYKFYDADLKNKTEKEQTNFLYSKAYENFIKDPIVIFKFMKKIETTFLDELPTYYSSLLCFRTPISSSPDFCSRITMIPTVIRSVFIKHIEEYLFIAAIIMGLLVGFLSDKKGLFALWGLTLIAFLASSSIVFFDGGWRVFASAWPLFLVFFVSGLRSPLLPIDKNPLKLTCRCMYGIILLVIISSCICPYIAHKSGTFTPDPALMTKTAQDQKEIEFVIPNLKKLVVIAVCNDNEKRIVGVPNISPAFFESCYKESYMKNDLLKFDYKESFLFFMGYDFYTHYPYYIFAPVSYLDNKADHIKINCSKYNLEGNLYWIKSPDFTPPLVIR